VSVISRPARPGANNEERRPTYKQIEKAHEDPNHHRRHVRRHSLLDGRPPYAHDNEAQTVNDGETRIYRAGESWSEPPGAIHSISRNASKIEPAKLLAVFVPDANENPLTTPIK
jgi:hypothetical protein